MMHSGSSFAERRQRAFSGTVSSWPASTWSITSSITGSSPVAVPECQVFAEWLLEKVASGGGLSAKRSLISNDCFQPHVAGTLDALEDANRRQPARPFCRSRRTLRWRVWPRRSRRRPGSPPPASTSPRAASNSPGAGRCTRIHRCSGGCATSASRPSTRWFSSATTCRREKPSSCAR